MLYQCRPYHRSHLSPVSVLLGLAVWTLAGCVDGTSSKSTSGPPPLTSVPAPHGPPATTGGFAYAVNTDHHTISGYLINSATGALSPMPGSPFAAGFQPNSIAVTPNGKFAYTANHSSDNVTAYTIAANGVLTQVTGSPFGAGDQPDIVTVDPTGKFVYVINVGSNNISAYAIQSNGSLAPVGTVATGAAPLGIAVDPTGKFVYVANYDLNSVSAYEIEANGALTPVPGSPFAAGSAVRGPNAVTVGVGPSARFVYTANVDSSNVTAWEINAATGALTTVPGSPFPSGAGPEGIAVDPTGQFAYVGNGTSHNVSAYRINADGSLTEVLPRVKAGDDPEGVTVDSTGKFVYAVNHGEDTISAYTRNPVSGALTEVAGSPFAF